MWKKKLLYETQRPWNKTNKVSPNNNIQWTVSNIITDFNRSLGCSSSQHSMKLSSSIILILGACLCLVISADAKRVIPKTVPYVIRDGIEYSAPLDRIGFVVATWIKTKREIWSRQVYVIKYEYKNGLEEDVQWVFINDLRYEDGKLKIRNEREDEFELDPETLNIKVLKGSAVIDFTNLNLQ
jgi:hypothetical protein